MTDPFWSLYERWATELKRADPGVRQSLADGYRRAWLGGDREDRYAVLDFIRRERIEPGYDLIVQGVQSDDEGLATHAVAIALFLISKGTRFEPGINDSLEAFGRRFPGQRVLSNAAQTRLAESDHIENG